MTTPEPESGPESEDEEVDLFAELGVEAPTSADNSSDGLEAFMDDDEDGDMPTESVPVEEENHEDDDDEDLFATLGVAGPSVALSTSEDEDILAAFMDDDEIEEETNEEETNDEEPAPELEPPEESQDDAVDAYRMVLETVWVDGILDPGEVHLLAKRREDLGISFEKHLEMVREMLG